ncbi:MAG TPA: LysM domain-containing protein [Burkholderiaceae bacterium]|nr:LysM domain-containing protein [Burkholderiaceae bacterium]
MPRFVRMYPRPRAAALTLAAALGLGGLATAGGALAADARTLPVTPQQRSLAQTTAARGIPEAELAPGAPDVYTVKTGDTLWSISGLYLRSPWRWPELWGMNLQDVRNPHLIYPGQRLTLDRQGGFARLRGGAAEEPPTVIVSPATRYETLKASAIPAIPPHLIEPFLAEPLIVDATTLDAAPHLLATSTERVMMSRGDRIYARSNTGAPPLLDDPGEPRLFRIFRNAVPLKDPETQRILAYEAQFLGRARLVRGEHESIDDGSGRKPEQIAATLEVTQSKEEIRAGDRLLPDPSRTFMSYVPHVSPEPIRGRIVSVYGSAVVNAAQNQIVVINRGTSDGVELGNVFGLFKDGGRLVDKTDPARPNVRLPDERNGLMMVFRPFENVSYALVLQIRDGVRVGDRFGPPQVD